MSIGNVRFIYCSTATSVLEKDNFIDLIRRSVLNNKELSLTGILLFDGQYFFQVLEGDEKDVQIIMAKIRQDERHINIHTLSDKPIAARLFPKWSMELIDANNSFFSETYGGNFQPYEFSEIEALDCATNAKAYRMRRLQDASC